MPNLSILACMFQGGGNIPLILPILAELVARGHIVRVLVGPGVRRSRLDVGPSLLRRLEEMAVEVIRLRVPDVHPFDDATLRECGWIGSWTPRAFRTVQGESRTPVWASAWAQHVSGELRRQATDLVIADFVLLGALLAAEAARLPHVALMHTVYPWPTPDVPAYGPGYLPSRSLVGACRDMMGRAIIRRLWARNALPPLTRARHLLGLPELRSPFQQYDAAARVLVLVSEAFDWPFRHLPPNVRHVGTPGDRPNPSQSLDGLLGDATQPLVVVSLSTLDQGQTAVLKKILVALSDLPISALVTVGPSLDPKQFHPPRNARLERFVPHDAVLPRAAALVTQCGIGTLTKALRHGVPMLCLPLVGDQHDNAARLVARGAGLRLDASASPDQIRYALARITGEVSFGESARRLGDALIREPNPIIIAADEIEQVASLSSLSERHIDH